ncbi:hypothetical protein M9H77_12724 [Catharanthus roseus]|uniref:Uncharacterized protein n=1 Tax=Catharanthus roseus TaxID=4058 RepID=A0ACC0BIA8_CATRO|nr:hypothetical protein M9H77_12724 [Catharanthus roseus]
MRKPRGPFNLNLVVWKGTLGTLGGGWNKRNMSMQWVDTMKIMDIKHILKVISIRKLDKRLKVLGIPTWMKDMGVGIHTNKKLGTTKRKPINLKRA